MRRARDESERCLAEARGQVAELRGRVAELQAQLTDLTSQLATARAASGSVATDMVEAQTLRDAEAQLRDAEVGTGKCAVRAVLRPRWRLL